MVPLAHSRNPPQAFDKQAEGALTTRRWRIAQNILEVEENTVRPEEITRGIEQRQKRQADQLDLTGREIRIVRLGLRDVGMSEEAHEVLLAKRRKASDLHHLVVELGAGVRHIGDERDVMKPEP